MGSSSLARFFAAGLMSQLWQLYLFYGVISGLGVGFIYPSMMAYVVRLFPDRSGMASGLGTAAYGFGAILWAPTAAALMEKVGLGSAFRVLGVLFAAVILLGSLLLAEPPEGFHRHIRRQRWAGERRRPEPGTDGAHRGLLPDGGGIYLRPGGRSDRHQPGLPHPPADPRLRPRPGRPLRQRVLRLQHGRPLRVGQPLRPAGPGQHRWGGVPAAHPVHGCPVVTGARARCSFMGVAASCYGGLASLLTPLTARMFGPRYITENYGVMYVVFGLASLIGPSLATTFKTAGGGSYTGAYVTAAVLAVIGLALSRSLKAPSRKGE